jgi:DNA-binding transcriptional regulator YiaG
MTQTLIDAAKQCPEMIVSIKVGDLVEANNLLLEQARARLEQKIADASAETYLSKDKVCEMLDVSVTTLWRWEKVGYLVPLNFGGQKRYRKSDIEKILEGAK